jgi:3-hydroxybutyryl-CoA dehydrogenase
VAPISHRTIYRILVQTGLNNPIEAISLVEQGLCDMADVDLAWTQHLGHRCCLEGPFQFLDESGLVTWYLIFQYLCNELKDTRFQPPSSLKRKVDARELGLKIGKGFYDYSKENVDAIAHGRDKKLLHLLNALKELG